MTITTQIIIMALNTLTMTIDMLLMAVTFHYIKFTEVAEADMRRYSYFLVYMISLPELVVCLSPIDLLFRKDYTFRYYRLAQEKVS